MLIKYLFKHWTYQVFLPGTVLREKYEAFKSLLACDKRAHELIAELEEIYHDQIKVDFTVVENKYEALSNRVGQIVENLRQMCPSRYLDLKDYFKKFDFYIRFMLSAPDYDFSPPFTLPLGEIPEDALSVAGGKALHLSTLGKTANLPTPAGFVITTSAYFYLIEFNNLRNAIDSQLAALDIQDTQMLNDTSAQLTEMILNAPIPPDIETSIEGSMQAVTGQKARNPRFAVRSSAVGEDSRSSFAGQYQTVLNVGKNQVLDAYRRVIASKYSPEALYYRINFGLTDIETPMAVLILEMIDAKASGVIYTMDMEQPETDLMEIHAIWGLGELLVQGAVTPDVFKVRKSGTPAIAHRRAAIKQRQMVFSDRGGTSIEKVPEEKIGQLSLEDQDVLTLAGWGMRLETRKGEPQDVEWCMDAGGNFFLLQSRPLRTGEDQSTAIECTYEEIPNPVLISCGDRASSGVGTGRVFKILKESDLSRIPEKAVLVAKTASSRYVKVMNKLRAVVTDTGSTAGHFASVAREFGVPLLVNTGDATRRLPQDAEVTVYPDGKKVYAGVVHSLMENPCAQKNLMTDSPFSKKLEYVISFISPLRLVDPDDPGFLPGGCRSLHDIIRFAHEMSVREMFTIGNRKTGRRMGAKKLNTPIPMTMYMLDVGGGLSDDAADKKEIEPAHILSIPFQAVWRGLSHPDIEWSQFSHFNWEEYDRIVMSGGIISAESAQLASYAIFSSEYLNLNLKFGYHFVILDTICSDQSGESHILFRFTGGGGDTHGRSLRAEFLRQVLNRMGFEVNRKSDLVDARFTDAPKKKTEEKLDMLGRLLGATRLMDMYLKEKNQVGAFVEEFLKGRYHFASEEMDNKS